MIRPRSLARAAALAAALLVPTAGLATATIPDDAALPDDAVDATRYAGNDRYATATRTALAAFPDGATTAVIARGDDFPDGLAASSLAGARNAPVLLTRPDQLPLETQDAFQPLGTQRVVIIGGPGAIDATVEDRLVEIFGEDDVSRVGGSDRFQTAALVAQELGAAGTIGDVTGGSDGQLRTAIVASGRNFPDALAAGPLANAAGLPVLLTERDSLPDVTRFAIESGIQQVVVAGGPVSVSRGVLAQLRQLDGVQVAARVSGRDRAATAVALGEVAQEQLGWPGRTAMLASGADFPDALSLAPAAARAEAPIYLSATTSEVGAATFRALEADCETLQQLVIAGGPVAVDATAERQAELATACADHQVPLQPDQVVSGSGDAAASGSAWVWTDSLCYAVRVAGLSSPPTAAHLHGGDAGSEGPVAATLDLPTPPAGVGLAVGCLTEEEVQGGSADELRAALREDAAGFYVDVHTEDHPGGAVRGQLG